MVSQFQISPSESKACCIIKAQPRVQYCPVEKKGSSVRLQEGMEVEGKGCKSR